MIDENALPHVKYLSFLVFSAPFFFWSAFWPVSASAWLGIPVGAALTLLLLWPCSRLLCSTALRNRPEASFPILLVMAIISLILALAFFQAQNLFLERCLFPQIPLWVIGLLLAFFTLWMAFRGLLPLLGFAGLAGLPILAFFLISTLSAASRIDPHFTYCLLPFTVKGFLSSALTAGILFFLHGLVLLSTLSLPSRETRPLTCTPPGPPHKKTVFRETVLGLLFSAVFLSVSHWVATLALGPAVFESLPFPLYYPPGLSAAAEYLERTELLLLVVFFFSAISNLSVLLLAVKNGLPLLQTRRRP